MRAWYRIVPDRPDVEILEAETRSKAQALAVKVFGVPFGSPRAYTTHGAARDKHPRVISELKEDHWRLQDEQERKDNALGWRIFFALVFGTTVINCLLFWAWLAWGRK